MTDHQANTVRDKFDERWRVHAGGYEDFTKKISNPNHVVRGDVTISQVHRAIISKNIIEATFPKGATLVEAACGNGFLSNYLAQIGYKVMGFDVADSGIECAVNMAKGLGIDPAMFKLSDHFCLDEVGAGSVDCVLALGLMRYLDAITRDQVYSKVARVLKPGGRFLVTHDNQLFEVFALNEGTINFWSKVLVGFSDATTLLPGDVREVMTKTYPLPKRVYSPHSVSKHIERHSENPLAFGETVEPYGFVCEDLYYPDSHILPPLLEASVDQLALETIKARTTLSRAHGDWRAMFLDFEFLAVLRKK